MKRATAQSRALRSLNHWWPPTLALLAALGMTDIREMNALKIVLVAVITAQRRSLLLLRDRSRGRGLW